MKDYVLFWKNAFNFTGVADRKKFLIPELINFSIVIVLAFFSYDWSSNLLNLFLQQFKNRQVRSAPLLLLLFIFVILLIIPHFSMYIRRFRDIGLSFWWVILLFLIRIVVKYYSSPTGGIVDLLILSTALLPTNFLKNLKRHAVKK